MQLNYIEENMNIALKLYESGDLSGAEGIYKQILNVDNNNSTALHYLGVVSFQLQNYEFAINCIKKAIELKPDSSDAYYNLGTIYSYLKQLPEAINCYEKATEVNPNNFNAYNNLATSFVLNNQLDKAAECYKKIVESYPEHLDIYNKLGDISLKIRRFDEAVFYYRKVLELSPENIEAYFNLGLAFSNSNKHNSAIDFFNKSLKLNPDNAEAYFNLGSVFYKIQDYDQSINYYKKAIGLNPDYIEAYQNIGVVLNQTGQFKEAIYYFKKIIRLNPNYNEAYYCIGSVYHENYMPYNAIKYYEKAVQLNPGHVNAHLSLGLMYLLTENFKEGWKHCEWRLKIEDKHTLNIPNISKLSWNGDSLEDKTIYVYYDQGLGDTVQFSRFLPDLVSMGARVIFKPQGLLNALLKPNFPDITFIDQSIPDDEVAFDEHVPIFNLPYLLKVNLDNIPLSEGYLKADKEKTEFYKENFFNNDAFKLGICWQGNKNNLRDKCRSIPLSYFVPFTKLPDIQAYSLQKNPGADQLKHINAKITDLGETFDDLGDTAAAIENLDLIITIDSVIAHLAGAMGKPVWIITPSLSEWRWLLNRDDSPWYKSAKLFRPKTLLNWQEDTMDRVFEAFKKNRDLLCS